MEVASTVWLHFYTFEKLLFNTNGSNDFKTVDPRKDGLIWYGNWKTFWSYQHPRNWANLSSQEIVDDILGL